MNRNGNESSPEREPLQDSRPTRRARPMGRRWYVDRDLVLICALVVLLGIYLWNTATLPSDTPNAADIGPKAYPWILVAILILLLCVLIAQTAIRLWKETSSRKVGSPGAASGGSTHTADGGHAPRRLWRLLAVVVLSIAYLQVVPSWGFLVATAVYLLLQVIVMSPEPRRYWGIRLAVPIVFAIVIAAAVELLFVEVLGVFLPAGILTV